MDITLSSLTAAQAASGSEAKISKDMKQAGQEFEALMISQMLKSARRAGESGWMGGESKSPNPVIDMAEEQLARSMAANGAFGIAKMLAASTGKNPLAPNSSGQSAEAESASATQKPALPKPAAR